MDFFFKPERIALIGASANPRKSGYSILNNLIKGFEDRIFPVNPRYDEIEGLRCYPSIAEVPGPVDLAIVFVPAKFVGTAVQACADKGIPGVMIQSAGFAETGAEGQLLQEELQRIHTQTGIRIWGPNCMGLFDALNGRVLSFMSPAIWDQKLITGKVSLIVQSGMLSAGFLVDTMTNATMGISKACSIGNKVDVNECDLLEYLIADRDTNVIGLYLESIADGRRFIELCRKAEKPIVVLKGGKSKQGAKAAMSHTASMAGNGAVVSGALTQAGVVEADDFKQLMDLCRTFEAYPQVSRSGQGRVAVLTFSGAAGIVAADFVEAYDLEVATLSPETYDALNSVFPAWMPPSNPVDLWPAVELNGLKKVWHTAMAAVCKDPNVDAVFFHQFRGGFAGDIEIAPLVEIAQSEGKPLFGWLIGKQSATLSLKREALQLGVPFFMEIRRAVECMAAYLKYTDQATLIGDSSEQTLSKGRIEMPSHLHNMLQAADNVIDEHFSKQILSAAGVPVVSEKIATSLDETRSAAEEFGFPLVMKGIMPGQVHKTESNLVRLGITSPAGIDKAYRELSEIMAGEGEVLVQTQIEGAVELIAGVVRDPQFGPCIMCGLGGVMAEVLNDRVFAVAPLSRVDAFKLLDRLKSQKLLNGFRGAPPVDRDVLADILQKLGQLTVAFPAIQEIDINPLIINNGIPVAVDAAIIVKQ